MAQLVDTNILGRLADLSDPLHLMVNQAVAVLHQRGEVLHVTPQNLIEFRNVATRPLANNGLGFTAALAEAHSSAFESMFPLLMDTPSIFPAWKAIVENLGVLGKQVHDARLVAVCHVHGVTHVLTFNTKDFARFSGFGPGIIVVDPATV
jgi:predicted nucleic acid-binding protein